MRLESILKCHSPLKKGKQLIKFQTGDRDYRALSFQIKIMMEQIEAVKVLQKKALDLKKELKFDISTLNDEIDEHIALIANKFDITTLKTF